MSGIWQDILREASAGRMVRTHSAQVEPGDIFVALPGTVHDGTAYIPQALERGAQFVVAGRDVGLPEGKMGMLAVHPSPAQALGELARVHFKTDRLGFPVVGVTGTNGKTTVSAMIEHLFTTAGRRVGVIGTINRRWPGHLENSSLTTPGCWELHGLLAAMAKTGVDVACLEVSSHALEQDRVAGVDFSTGVFTNLTQDHLDYHQDMEAYFLAKSKLFSAARQQAMTGVINLDDPYGRRLADSHVPVIGFSLKPRKFRGECLHGKVLRCDRRGILIRMDYQGKSWELASGMVGQHNGSNLLAAQGVGLSLGLHIEQLKGLESFQGVSGRLERVANGAGLDIFVDYAHTPDALENVLQALEQVGFKKIITVFGCGGDRDAGKRPLMGRAVASHSDVAVLTSDNPRHEDPDKIMDQVMPGLNGCAAIIREADRRKAIELAIGEMEPGDALLIAGKGHETTQQIGDVRLPFSDQQVVREVLS